MAWKRKNGNGESDKPSHLVRDAESGDVYFRVSLDRQLAEIRDEVRELSEWLSRYEGAHEQSARERHQQMIVRIDAYQRAVEQQRGRDVA